MSKQLFDQGSAALQSRTTWENKQRLYYQMRHDGLRRINKPWPTAADLHFPLIDMNIRKVKPFWESQAMSNDRLASFAALNEQQATTTSAAADYFDYYLKQETNFQVELIRAIDFMLLRGRGALKAIVDPFDGNRIVFEAIDPVFLIIADGADDFADADWFIHVQQKSVAAYKRDRRYLQEDGLINSIRGSKDLDTSSVFGQDKEVREGVQYSRNPDQIIIWEHWVKTMGGWTIYTYSPQAPDKQIRKPIGCVYKRKGKASVAFYSFKTEIKDKGWYSPRGLAELNAPFEQYACKLWNEKTDAMTFGNRPVFTSENQIPNTANIRFMPGEFIPGNIKQVQTSQPAFSFDQEIAFTRSISEQQSMVPDFGIMEPQKGGNSGEPTATKVRAVTGMQSVGTDSNGKIFRMDLAKVYRHVWAMMLQFKRGELTYFVGQELKTLPEQALHDAYLIEPDGAPDQWNKQLRQQRADARFSKFNGNPFVNQEELVYENLSADDPLIAQKLFIPGNVKAGSEAEDEAVEITIMQDGFPAQVKPNEDHVTRIHVLMGWLQKQSAMGVPVNPLAKQRIQQHLAVHWQMLQQTQPEAAKALKQQILQQEQAAMMKRQAIAAGAPPPDSANLNPS